MLDKNYEEVIKSLQPIFIGNFQSKKWYFLGLEHEKRKEAGKSILKITINDEYREINSIGYPNVESAATITKLAFGTNLIGRISSVMLFKSLFRQNK